MRFCPICRGVRWVCENHPDRPWGDAGLEVTGSCACGAGAPCVCNPSAEPIPDSELIAGNEPYVYFRPELN